MKIVESKALEGLCILTSVDGKTFLHFDRNEGPSVTTDGEEATPLPEVLAHKLLKAVTVSHEFFVAFPEVERFLERAVVKKVEAQMTVIELDNSDLMDEGDLAPSRVLH